MKRAGHVLSCDGDDDNSLRSQLMAGRCGHAAQHGKFHGRGIASDSSPSWTDSQAMGRARGKLAMARASQMQSPSNSAPSSASLLGGDISTRRAARQGRGDSRALRGVPDMARMLPERVALEYHPRRPPRQVGINWHRRQPALRVLPENNPDSHALMAESAAALYLGA